MTRKITPRLVQRMGQDQYCPRLTSILDQFSGVRSGKLRSKLGDAGGNPTYIFTESSVGYRMPKGEEPGGGAL